ncbi:hypothetical protein TYRP_012672 [Tyrophagus putrescentiae]|nr:hypothetical protein TYRP_012672 [Tyrophagus putrescentiae]
MKPTTEDTVRIISKYDSARRWPSKSCEEPLLGLLVEQWRSVESRAVEPGAVNSRSAVNSAGDHRGGGIATVGHIAVHWDDRRGGVVDVAGQRAGHLAGGEVVVVAEDVLDAALGADGEGGHHGEQHGKSEDLKRKKRMKRCEEAHVTNDDDQASKQARPPTAGKRSTENAVGIVSGFTCYVLLHKKVRLEVPLQVVQRLRLRQQHLLPAVHVDHLKLGHAVDDVAAGDDDEGNANRLGGQQPLAHRQVVPVVNEDVLLEAGADDGGEVAGKLPAAALLLLALPLGQNQADLEGDEHLGPAEHGQRGGGVVVDGVRGGGVGGVGTITAVAVFTGVGGRRLAVHLRHQLHILLHLAGEVLDGAGEDAADAQAVAAHLQRSSCCSSTSSALKDSPQARQLYTSSSPSGVSSSHSCEYLPPMEPTEPTAEKEGISKGLVKKQQQRKLTLDNGQLQPREDLLVGLAHLLVGLNGEVLVLVEGVQVWKRAMC